MTKYVEKAELHCEFNLPQELFSALESLKKEFHIGQHMTRVMITKHPLCVYVQGYYQNINFFRIILGGFLFLYFDRITEKLTGKGVERGRTCSKGPQIRLEPCAAAVRTQPHQNI